MRRAVAGFLVVSALLTACQTKVPTVRSAARPTPTAPAPAATSYPAPRLLQKPSTGVSTLSGTVRLDATYIVASGAGNIVATGGGNIVASGGGNIVASGGGNVVVAGGGKIISTNGGGVISGNGSAVISGNGSAVISGNGSSVISGNGSSVISGNGSAIISTNGGGIVASGGGNIISGNGSAIVASGGGNIVASGGGNIVASGGGNIIGGNASAIVASGGGNRRVLEAAEPGALTAVAGMPIGLFSLATHQEIPVGVDAAGKPVYTVYTDMAGRYELYPPTTDAANLLVVAHVLPASEDPRLHVALVTPARTGADLDEDSAALTALIRKAFVRRLERILTAQDADLDGITKDLLGEFPDLPPNFAAPLAEMVKALHTDGAVAGLPGKPPAEVQPLAQRVADLMVRELQLSPDDPDAIQIVTGPGKTEPFYPAMLRAFARCRTGAASHDAAFFDAQPYFQLVQDQRKAAGLPPYRIQKPADLNAFVADEYFGEADPRVLTAKTKPAATPDLFGILDVVMRSVGVDDQTQTVRYGHNALLTGLMFKFVGGAGCDTSLRHRVGEMIRGGPNGSPPPLPASTCAPD